MTEDPTDLKQNPETDFYSPSQMRNETGLWTGVRRVGSERWNVDDDRLTGPEAMNLTEEVARF